MFHPKHVELFAGNKTLYKKCHLGTFLKFDTFIILGNIDEFKTPMKYCVQKPAVGLRTFKL
jgi:hypothetical protein